MVHAFFLKSLLLVFEFVRTLHIPVSFYIESLTATPSYGVQYSISMTLTAVSFKVVILLLFIHYLPLLPFGVCVSTLFCSVVLGLLLYFYCIMAVFVLCLFLMVQ